MPNLGHLSWKIIAQAAVDVIKPIELKNGLLKDSYFTTREAFS
jgi:hypothetical protein